MSDPLALLAAFALGLLLGGVFFGGLWWTVARGVVSRHAARWFIVSLLLRSALVLIGFTLVARGSWQRLLVCLAGFILARVIVTRFTVAAAPSAPALGSGSHAP
ncbi:MAG TPA: ATP synthase subunit I [Steroidobacteraceae bacterium]